VCYVWQEKKSQSRLSSSSKEFTTLKSWSWTVMFTWITRLVFHPCLLPKSIIFHLISNWFKHLSISVSFISFSSSKLCFHKIPPLTEKSSLVVIFVSLSTSSERKRSIVIIVEVVVTVNGFLSSLWSWVISSSLGIFMIQAWNRFVFLEFVHKLIRFMQILCLVLNGRQKSNLKQNMKKFWWRGRCLSNRVISCVCFSLVSSMNV